jgi:hypothetical protein
MADDKFKIDRAAARMAQEHPLEAFDQPGDPGYFYFQYTSTAKAGEVARIHRNTLREWTPMMHESIRQEYVKLEASSTGWHGREKHIIGQLSDLYGRGRSVITGALSLFKRSTD